MKYINVKFVKLSPNAKVPLYASDSAAGADLFACIAAETTIYPGNTVMIPTGIALELPPFTAGLICARSSLASAKGLAPANKVGIVDPDFRGDIIIPLHNHASLPASISPGERIAQLLVVPVFSASFIESNALNPTSRGLGGYGSTGRF